MPHNLTITYNRSQISITPTHPHLDLRVHTTTADNQGQRTEDFSLELGRPTHRQAPSFPTPNYLHPNDHQPIASEATFARDGRLRVPQPQQQPPLLDSHDAITGRYEPPPRQAARDAPAARGDTYYSPDYANASPGHATGVERVHYDPDPGPGPGRIVRPHDQPSPCISITPASPSPSPDASRSQGAVVRPAYCGGEMVLCGYGGGGGGYHDDDGGGVGGGVWSDPYSDAEDGSEWSGGGEGVGFGFGGKAACGYR